jgi:CTP synthase
VELQDAYISVDEALKHAGFAYDADVEIKKIQSENITEENVAELLQDCDGLLVPGGFGTRGLEGMITAIKYAREHDLPFLGICLGMQMACVEFARDVLNEADANSTEADPKTKHNVIDLMADQVDQENIGGTLRLGLYPARLKQGTKTAAAYANQTVIQERHRHRYEFNNAYRESFEQNGMIFSGVSPDNHLVEIVEYPQNKFFIACQYHPEFLSRPLKPEGLFKAFMGAASGLPAVKL